jgi:inositol oxygenase
MSHVATAPTVADPAANALFHQNIANADKYRNYEAEARSVVKGFYQENHQKQTLAYVLGKEAEYASGTRARLGIWEALEKLNTLVDDSDPDNSLPQIYHALQTAEAIRHDGHPRWFILAGLIHDMGKMLCFFGEPQWAVVGDTFPVGCAYSDKIVYPDFFMDNPDYHNPMLQTPNGIYKPHCGLDNLHISWGHDEYLYQVTKPYLPNEALWMLRYHSCYVIHRENEYKHLLNESDEEKLHWIRAFNPYDLYSKCEVEPNVEELKPFYQELIAEYFPDKLDW